MQVTASNKYENVYPHRVPTRPSRLPQFVSIKPRPSVPKMASMWEHLTLGEVGENLPGTREVGLGQPQSSCYNEHQEILQNRQSTGTNGLGWGEYAKCIVEAGSQFCQAGGHRGVSLLRPTRLKLIFET